jgi:hypothetical protein
MNLKTQMYQYLFNINRDFQQVAESIGKLREIRIFPESSVRAWVNRAEEFRALMNLRCVGMLECIEEREAFRFASLARTDEEAVEPISDDDDPPALSESLKLPE